jgi:ADP-heptose:LPS heptosyltransferase
MPPVNAHRIDGYHVGPLDRLSREQARDIVRLIRQAAPAGAPGLSGRGGLVRGRVAGVGAVVVKAYRRGGLLRHLNRRHHLHLAGRTRGEREFDMLARARAAGIEVPEPVAYAWEGRGVIRAWLVSREAAGAEPLSELARRDPEGLPALAPAVAGLIARTIDARICHADLHPGNILVDASGRVCLVDLDKGRRWGGSLERLERRIRRRFRRAVAKHRLPWALNGMLPPGAGRAAAAPSLLVVLMGSIGDVARGLAVLAPLKERFPEGRVHWLVEPKSAALARMHPLIDEVLVFRRSLHPAALLEIARALARRRFDVTLDLQRHLKSGLFSRLSGARRRIGFHRRDAKELNWLFNNEHIPACPRDFPKLRHYGKFCEALGAVMPEPPRFGLAPPEGLLPAALAALERPYVAVALGSSWPSKDWTAAGYRRLIALLIDRLGLSVVLVGDGSQSALGRELAAGYPPGRLLDLAARTSLPELAAVLKAAAAAAGPDCGAGHLAAAVGTPYVSLFGPTAAARTAPHGWQHLAVQGSADCAPCMRRRCPLPGRPCMAGIAPEAVAERLQAAIGARRG